MRTFLQLLPFRIEQALGPFSLRSLRTRLLRGSRSSADGSFVTPGRRLFVDVAVISKHDAGTGIQRVVGGLAAALAAEAPGSWDVRFVSARRKRRYFEIAFPSPGGEQQPGAEMRAAPGDVFLGLDYALDTIRQHRAQLRRFRRDGGAVWFFVHDLLPFNRPEWFSRNTVIRYRAWLGVLASTADGFFCNSPQTEQDLRKALAEVFHLADGYHTQVLPMGHEIAHPDRDRAKRGAAARLDLGGPFALMVGTVEPRKGHGDIITAFEMMWQCGCEDRLVIVGRRGWRVEELQRRIDTHPQLGSRLFWFDDVEDDELLTIYDACTGVIIGSHGEGYGLPVIEALGRAKPVLARDLAVFRIHQGCGVWFFETDATGKVLADSIQEWLRAAHRGAITVRLPNQSWMDSARILLSTIDRRAEWAECETPARSGRQATPCGS